MIIHVWAPVLKIIPRSGMFFHELENWMSSQPGKTRRKQHNERNDIDNNTRSECWAELHYSNNNGTLIFSTSNFGPNLGLTSWEQLKVGAVHLSGAKNWLNHRAGYHEKNRKFFVSQYQKIL